MAQRQWTPATKNRDMFTVREAADQLSLDAERLATLTRLLKIPYWCACISRQTIDEALRAGKMEDRLHVIRTAIFSGCRPTDRQV
jgi:hypothetical protein